MFFAEVDFNRNEAMYKPYIKIEITLQLKPLLFPLFTKGG